MKKKKLNSTLSLGKISVSNLSNIKGGDHLPPQTEDGDCYDTGGSGGSGNNTYTCPTNNRTRYNCLTDSHPASDPIHCRGCVVGDWF